MLKYTIQRIIALLITLFIVLTLAFLVIRMMPGSPYEDTNLPPDVIRILEDKYHLNEPMIVQYGIFLRNIASGDWGTSITLQPRMPVWEVLYSKIPVTLQVNLFALIIALPIGIGAGVFAALFRNTLVDHAISFVVVVFISVPSFVFAALLQYTIAFKLGWLPIIYSPGSFGTEKMLSIVLPVIALCLGPIARVTRYLRGELIETLTSEFMLLARTKGLTRLQATVRHAMRNSLIPLANIIIPMFTHLLTGSLVVERIYAVSGVGGLLVNAINTSDHPVTVAVMIFYSLLSLVTVLVVDLSYGIIDPRVRVGGTKNE